MVDPFPTPPTSDATAGTPQAAASTSTVGLPSWSPSLGQPKADRRYRRRPYAGQESRDRPAEESGPGCRVRVRLQSFCNRSSKGPLPMITSEAVIDAQRLARHGVQQKLYRPSFPKVARHTGSPAATRRALPASLRLGGLARTFRIDARPNHRRRPRRHLRGEPSAQRLERQEVAGADHARCPTNGPFSGSQSQKRRSSHERRRRGLWRYRGFAGLPDGSERLDHGLGHQPMGMDASKIPLGQEPSRLAIETSHQQWHQCPSGPTFGEADRG